MKDEMLTLKETVDLMNSDSYKERFQAEYFQLKIRLSNLGKMLEKWDNDELDFTPSCSRELLGRQVLAMTEYLNILEERATIEDVEL
jgi:hypothetical protein